METQDYQQAAARTLIDRPDATYTDDEIILIWCGMGLAGEAGEVADSLKKMVFHRHGIDREQLIKELGDVCWYVAALCTRLDVPLGEVMARNIAKLRTRFPDGYSSAAILAARRYEGVMPCSISDGPTSTQRNQRK